MNPTVWPQYTNVTDRQTGQRSDRIGRTVLQTVAQKTKHNKSKQQKNTAAVIKTEQEGQHPLTGQHAANFRLLANQ